MALLVRVEVRLSRVFVVESPTFPNGSGYEGIMSSHGLLARSTSEVGDGEREGAGGRIEYMRTLVAVHSQIHKFM